MVKYSCYVQIYFSAMGRLGVHKTLYRNFRTTCCYLCTIKCGKLKLKLEIAIVKQVLGSHIKICPYQ